jgi:hypothetical protein
MDDRTLSAAETRRPLKGESMPAVFRLRSIEIAVSFVLAAAPVSAQQGQDAMIVGTVRDASRSVIVGANVTVSSGALVGGPRSVTTDRAGGYRVPALAPGDYDVIATAPGFRLWNRAGISLRPGATATIDATLALEGVVETMSVTPNLPSGLDVHTSAASTVIPRAILDNLPLSRNASSLVNLVPGVINDVAFGGSRSANLFTLDGATGTEPGWGIPVADPSPSWIEQLQVVTFGADAQFGEYTGAAMNALTRSGTNRRSGEISFWTTRPSWTSNNRAAVPPNLASSFRPLEVLERWTLSAQLGGPARKDALWYFGAVDFYRDDIRPAGFASVASPPEDAVFSLKEPRLFGKVTAATGSDMRWEAYVARSVSKSHGANASPRVRPEALTAGHWRQTLWNGRMTWVLSERMLLEARHGGHDTRSSTGPEDPAARYGPSSHFDTVTGVRSINAGSYFESLTRVVSTSAALTRYADGMLGRSHAFKFGVEYESATLRTEEGFPGGMLFYDAGGQPNEVYIRAPVIYRPDHRRYMMYAQDNWQVTSTLTINTGIRAEKYAGAVEGFPTQFSTTSVSPRAGIAWDPLAAHSFVMRAHYGRYHDAMVTSFYDFLDPLSRPLSIYAQVLGPNEFAEIFRMDPSNTYTIDPNVNYPYADEWFTAIERALSSRTSVTAQYVRRRFGGIIGFVGRSSAWTPAQRQDPGPDGRAGTGDDGGMMTIYLNNGSVPTNPVLTNPDGAYKHYDGVQLIVLHRATDRWQAQGSYTWSKTRATFDNAFSSNAANNDLSTNGVYVNPNRALFSTGRTSFDFTHELKVIGTLQLPWWGGFRLGGVYRYQTGTPWARVVAFPGPTQLINIRVEPRGTRVTPAPNVCDLRVEKTFRIATSTLGAYLDFFNVGNQGIARAYTARSGPLFGMPSGWSDPRIVRAGLRLMF